MQFQNHSFVDSASKMHLTAVKLLVQADLLPIAVLAGNVFRILRALQRTPRRSSAVPPYQTQTCLVHTLAAAAVTVQMVNHALPTLPALFQRTLNQLLIKLIAS